MTTPEAETVEVEVQGWRDGEPAEHGRYFVWDGASVWLCDWEGYWRDSFYGECHGIQKWQPIAYPTPPKEADRE